MFAPSKGILSFGYKIEIAILLSQTDMHTWTDGKRASRRKVGKTSKIRRTLVGNRIIDHSDVVGVAPTTSSFST